MPATLDELFRRRVLFVTGKGGTGKSTIAAAIALLGAERGKRTLLLDVENKGDAARFLDADEPRYEPRRAANDLYHLGLRPDEVLDEYLRVALKLPKIYRIGPLHKVFDFIATAAPGVKEVLIAGKVGFEERARENGRPRWDLVVVDAAPAGQVVSHLRGPRTLQELVGVGMIRNQTTWVREIVEDPDKTGVVAVALAEEMPVSETADLLSQLPEAVNTPVLAVVANRLVPPPTHPDTLTRLHGADGLDDLRPALDAAVFFARWAENQAPFRERLRDLGPPTLEVPQLPVDRHDLDITREVARILDAEERVA